MQILAAADQMFRSHKFVKPWKFTDTNLHVVHVTNATGKKGSDTHKERDTDNSDDDEATILFFTYWATAINFKVVYIQEESEQNSAQKGGKMELNDKLSVEINDIRTAFHCERRLSVQEEAKPDEVQMWTMWWLQKRS